MNKYVKYTLKTGVIIIGILLLLYIIAYAYVSFNKKALIAQVNEEIAEKVRGNVSIGNIELSFIKTFPQVSVLIEKVSVTDTLFAQHKHPFFQADEVFLRISVINLIMKKPALNGIRVEKGSLYMFTDTSGYSNKYLTDLKDESTEAATKSRRSNQLNDIVLKDVRFTVDDRRRGKLHDLMIYNLKANVDEKDSSLIFKVRDEILVHSLAFNLPTGSFIKEKKFEGDFELGLNRTTKQLFFNNIKVSIGGQPFKLTGRFDFKGASPQFMLAINTDNISFDLIKSLLTAKIARALSIVSIDKASHVKANLRGPLRGGDPVINVSWAAKNTFLTTPFLDFDNASFTGNYTNEVVKGLPRKDPNSKIEIQNFTAEWQGLPVTSNNINILNLYKPLVTCDLRSKFSLTKLNDIIGSSAINLNSGEGIIDLTYKGPIEKNNNTNSFLNGQVAIQRGELVYGPRDVPLNNVNGLLLFRNSDVFVQNLQCVVLNNKILMNGEAKNLLSLINTEPNKAQINWNIYAPSLNLAAFSYLLRPQKQVYNKAGGKNKLKKVATQIDDVLEKGALRVYLKAGKLFYKKFDASNAVVEISMLNDKWIIHKAGLEHAGGQMAINGELVNRNDNYHQAKANISLSNVDVSKVFAAFNNFGQDGITSKSLKGKLTSKVNISFGLNNDGKAYPSSIEGVVDFSLKNGALINYEPVQKLQNFLFQKRDFSNIQFAELKDRLEIKNQEVKINRMEIQSSVLTMFVEGVYSMKGNTDLSIQVPLSNLKKRAEDYKPENIGTDKKAGPSVFIRGRPGEDGNIKFKLDLFNKFRKDKG